MKKFKILSDPNNINLVGSTNIIVSSLNAAAKKLGLYDENGVRVTYDCLGNDHNTNPQAIICVFELPFINFIKNNLANRPFLGVSRDNLKFGLDGGYPASLSNYFNLGVDSDKYKYVYKSNKRKIFRFIAFSESNTRGMLEVTIQAFCRAFGGFNDIELLIKDRNSTNLFRSWVKEKINDYNANILYDSSEFSNIDEILNLASTSDACISINRSSTFNLKTIEMMSMGVASISNCYSGHREYVMDGFTALEVPFQLVEFTNEKLAELQSIGLNNYLFPREYFHVTPYWSEVSVEDLINKMLKIYNDKSLRDKISIGGRKMAETLSWERSAINLSCCLKEFGL